MHINWQLRELNLKIVYYGPALSGKTTNIEKIHSKVDPRRRSDLVSLKTEGDRTLFFDFLQLELGKIGTLTPKIHLYTVPGQSYYQASRKLVLRGTDGVVFVADSSRERVADNLESLRSMREHLDALGMPIDTLPIIFQWNKQDLDEALSPFEMKRLLNAYDHPSFSATAIEGVGVFETLKEITKSVVASVQAEVAV